MKIAVYGTLRKGQPNYGRFLRGLEPLCTYKQDRYEMYDKGYPYIIQGSGRVTLEVYEVEDEVAFRIAEMEIGAGYNVGIVVTPVGPALVFYFSQANHVKHITKHPEWIHKVTSGNWLEYQPERERYEYNR